MSMIWTDDIPISPLSDLYHCRNRFACQHLLWIVFGDKFCSSLINVRHSLKFPEITV